MKHLRHIVSPSPLDSGPCCFESSISHTIPLDLQHSSGAKSIRSKAVVYWIFRSKGVPSLLITHLIASKNSTDVKKQKPAEPFNFFTRRCVLLFLSDRTRPPQTSISKVLVLLLPLGRARSTMCSAIAKLQRAELATATPIRHGAGDECD